MIKLDCVESELKQARIKAWYQYRDHVKFEVRKQVWLQVKYQVGGQVTSEIIDQIWKNK